jgi:hypothetical protein
MAHIAREIIVYATVKTYATDLWDSLVVKELLLVLIVMVDWYKEVVTVLDVV